MNRLLPPLLNAKVAANWSELKPHQFIGIATHLHRYEGQALKTNITWSVLDLSWRTPRKYAAFFFGLNAEGRHKLCALAEPFTKPDGLLDTLLPAVRTKYGPLPCVVRDLLNELDVETWGVADAFFLRYQRTRDVQDLRRMAMALYCEPGTSTKDRLSNADEARFRSIPMGELFAIHTMWSGHRAVVEKESPKPFKSTNQKKAARRKTGWHDVLLSMAGTNSKFGPWNETIKTPYRVFFRALHDRMVEDEKREAERRKHTRR